nr:MAG TPA: Terminase small subunit [Caudoviricetes sp.]
MPRARNPNRDKAYQIYKEHGGAITNRDIAALLNEDEKVVAVWKSRDKWNVVQQSKESCTTKNKKEKIKSKSAMLPEVESVIQNPDLSDKQRLFCLYYVRCFNATKAYRKAYGCAYSTAAVEGFNTLRNPKIQNEIQALKQSRLNREFLDEHDIFQKYMDIAFADITDYVEFGREKVQVMGAFGPVEVKNPETGKKEPLIKEVNTVRFRESGEVDGTLISEVKQGKDGASIKLLDRMKALDWLAEHMDLASEEQKARIAQIKAQTEKLKGSDSSTELERLDEVLKEIKGVV